MLLVFRRQRRRHKKEVRVSGVHGVTGSILFGSDVEDIVVYGSDSFLGVYGEKKLIGWKYFRVVHSPW